MRNFWSAFLGSLAALWISAILLGVAFIIGIVNLAVSLGSTNAPSVEKNSVLLLDLDMSVTEWDVNVSLRDKLMGDAASTSAVKLPTLIKAIDAAADDKKISGMFIDCGGIDCGMAQLEAIGQAIGRFRASGKWVWAYGDQAIGQADYYLATFADSIFINPEGMIDLHGLTMFNQNFKGLLDKVGVEMQVVKVGTYKSAVEPYILDRPSQANIEQEQLFLTNVWQALRNVMAENRHVPADSVDSWVNGLSATKDAKWYVSQGLADVICYRREMLSRIKSATDRHTLNMLTPQEYARTSSMPKEKGPAKIAVYYAEGTINDDSATGISGRRMVDDLLELAEDEADDLSGLVIRVNSPGGSAYASEQIWDAVERFKSETELPVYVSMGDYAASGGYYISCGADRIFAQPTTLTGSIGIFGLIPNAQGLIEGKLGINTTPVSSHPGAEPITPFLPMTEKQTASMQAQVNRGYELFVKRVADGRHMSVDSVKAIAEGRVWDGREALARGLVDELGGLRECLESMARELNVENYEVVGYPAVNSTFMTMLLTQMGEVESLRSGLPRELAYYGPLLDALVYAREARGVQAYLPLMIIK